MSKFDIRRASVGVAAALILCLVILVNPNSYETLFGESAAESDDTNVVVNINQNNESEPLAIDILAKLEIKGRASKAGYDREAFYNNWPSVEGCSLRQRIIKREFGETAVLDGCNVVSGSFVDPYTGESKTFKNRSEISSGIQIDHVVALSNAWQTGAQYQSADERRSLATDPLNLLAVDGAANQQKSDGDAATWLPKNKAFRCQYVARQVSVKYKYNLWITQAEHDAIARVLEKCPNEHTLGVSSLEKYQSN